MLEKETKPGYKTTEFWMIVISALLVWVNGLPMPEKYEGAVIGGLAAAYAIARGLSKLGVPDEAVTILPVDPDDAGRHG